MVFKELEDLNETEQEILLASCDACSFTLSKRVPIQEIKKRVSYSHQRYFKKGFKTLLANGFIRKHPSGRNVTYELNRKGRDAGYIIENKIKEQK